MQPAILTSIVVFVAVCSLEPEAGATGRTPDFYVIKLTFIYLGASIGPF